MSGRMALVCAGSLFLLSAGCTLDSFRVSWFSRSANGAQPTLEGSLDAVSVSTQAALEQMGLRVTMTHRGEEVVLTSTTRSGQAFSLYLKREVRNGRESTRLDIQWDADPDTAFWLSFLELVARIHLEQASHGATRPTASQ